MCGLFTLRTRNTMIFKREVTLGSGPRYKVCPGESITTIRLDESTPVVSRMKWGFRPSWAPRNRICINIRSETAATSPMFKRAFNSARCLIPADGFFEPNRSVPEKDYVWFHRLDDQLFYFPGLWTVFNREDEGVYENCALLTTEPNQTVGLFHARMPVVLDAEQAEAWLESAGEGAARLQALLIPANDDVLAVRRVTPSLYRLRSEDVACIDAREQAG